MGQERSDNVVLIAIGGIKRTKNLQAIHETYGGRFQKVLYISDATPDDHTDASDSLRAKIVNAFGPHQAGPGLLSSLLHPDHPLQKTLKLNGTLLAPNSAKSSDPVLKNIYDDAHGIEWHLAQFKYMIGLAEAKRLFNDAHWFLLVDSDTYVYPSRLLRYTDALEKPHEHPLSFGFTRKAGIGKKQFRFFLGGAGVLLSRGAVFRMNLTKCTEFAHKHISWSLAAADWRLGLCLTRANVRKIHVPFMYQSNAQLTCEPYGSPHCAWGGSYHDYVVSCPLTLHYQTPELMHELHNQARGRDVCIPEPPAPWSDRSKKCLCVPFEDRMKPTSQKQISDTIRKPKPSRIDIEKYLNNLYHTNMSLFNAKRPVQALSEVLSEHFQHRIPSTQQGTRRLRSLIDSYKVQSVAKPP